MVPNYVEEEIRIEAPIDRVWEVVTRPRYILQWYAWGGAALDLQPGGAVELTWAERGTFHGQVTHVEPPHRYVYKFAVVPEQEPHPGNSTEVEITLRAEGGATRLRVVESGFRGLDGSDSDKAQYVAAARAAWQAALVGIPECVAQVSGAEVVFTEPSPR